MTMPGQFESDDGEEEPQESPLTPGDGLCDRFARMTGVPPAAADAMRDAVRRSLEEAGVDPGAVPPELAAAIEAQAQQFAQAREMGALGISMQAAGLHECFVALTAPDLFTESQALYYMAKCNSGI